MKKEKEQKQYKIAKALFQAALDSHGALHEQKLRSLLDACHDSVLYTPGMLRFLKKLCQNYFDGKRVVIETPIDLDAKTKAQLQATLNATHPIQTITNTSLLAGAKITVGWNEYDTSIASKLNRLLD